MELDRIGYNSIVLIRETGIVREKWNYFYEQNSITSSSKKDKERLFGLYEELRA